MASHPHLRSTHRVVRRTLVTVEYFGEAAAQHDGHMAIFYVGGMVNRRVSRVIVFVGLE